MSAIRSNIIILSSSYVQPSYFDGTNWFQKENIRLTDVINFKGAQTGGLP